MAKSKANTHARQLILDARHHDPFSFLGQHLIHENGENHFIYRAFFPHASIVQVKTGESWTALEKTHRDGLFELSSATALQTPCLLKVTTDGHSYETHDPYTFNTSITQDELYLFVKAA